MWSWGPMECGGGSRAFGKSTLPYWISRNISTCEVTPKIPSWMHTASKHKYRRCNICSAARLLFSSLIVVCLCVESNCSCQSGLWTASTSAQNRIEFICFGSDYAAVLWGQTCTQTCYSAELLRAGRTHQEKLDVALLKWKSWQKDWEKYVTLPFHCHSHLC